ncbi:hypothetical protein QLX08_010405 [Tetragonisca angustula]|uniref:Uncharacterized protein n=1 Tax=Tetragonisca angustula TaxID=166442 RepID=A0AAW0ZDL1_9HYME
MDWKKYMMTYMAGIEKFVLREDSRSIDAAQKRLLFLYRIHQIVLVSSVFVLLAIMLYIIN